MPLTFSTLGQLVAGFGTYADRHAIVAFHKEQVVRMSYGQLADEIGRLAGALRARGIHDRHLVALWAANSPEWVVAYFGVVRAGAAVIVLDDQSTVDGVARVLAHANPELILTTAAHAAELRAHDDARRISCLLLDGDEAAKDSWRHLGVSERGELPEIRSDGLASLLYTSGTTGTPKAVPLTHGNLSANAGALVAAKLIGPDDRVLVPLPLHHTYPFTVGLLTAFGSGATMILPSGISGPEISRAAQIGHATVLVAVPRLCVALWDGLVAEVRSRGSLATRLFFVLLAVSIGLRRTLRLRLGRLLFSAVHARLGGHLKLIGCGGAKLDSDLAWKLQGLGWEVLTGYGLTETSPVLTFNDWKHSRIGSEGRPLTGVELRIQPEMQPGQGEILARGPSVFAGYWNDPAATRAAFTDDGWFRTGDLGWLDPEGYLHVAGRSKDLIVLPDGKNVFPDEVEKVYSTPTLFREVAIFEREGALAALVVPDEATLRQRGALREATLVREGLEEVAASLPPYERVSDYRVTHAPLPRTRIGKLKRHLLPALYDEAANLHGDGPATAMTDEDRRLLGSARGHAVWQWLNGRYPGRQLSLDTSPQLDLQVDSLEWVAVTTEIEQRFRVSLSGEAVSRILSLRDLLREIEAAGTRVEPTAASGSTSFQPPGKIFRGIGAVIHAALWLLMRIAFRIEISGLDRLPQDGPLVLAPNHTSYLDPFVLGAALPWRQLRRTYWAGWVGEIYKNPLRRFMSRATQVFPVDPDRDLATALRTAQRLLQQGYSVVWFPEGRRSPTGELQPFQAGIGVLLQDATVAAVPIAIHGAFQAWPRHRRLPRLNRHRIRVSFGAALGSSREPGPRNADSLRDRLERSVRQLMDGP